MRNGYRLLSKVPLLVLVLVGLLTFPPLEAKAADRPVVSGRILMVANIRSASERLFSTTRSGKWRDLSPFLSTGQSVSADPRGRFAIFSAPKLLDQNGPERVFRVSLKSRRIVRISGRRHGEWPAVSPNGKRVAFVSDPGSGPATIYSMRVDGTNVQRLYSYCASCIDRLAWSGNRIFFQRKISRNISADEEIYSIRASDGGAIRQVTDDGGASIDYRLFDASPRGGVLIGVTESSITRLVVGTVCCGTTEVVDVGEGTLLSASFSPSDRLVAFSATDPGVYRGRLYIKNLSSGGTRELRIPAESTFGVQSLSWVAR